MAEGEELSPNTHFVFEHKVFAIEGAYFSKSSGYPALHVRLGEMDVSITMPQICSEFDIAPKSNDGRLLKLVESGLPLLGRIRPNDSIPSELLDGSASWSVEPQHLQASQRRISQQLQEWLQSGKDEGNFDLSLDSADAKEKVNAVFEEAAVKLGLGPDGKKQIADRVDQFAREFSYIEALKERIKGIHKIRSRLLRISSAARGDQEFVQEVMRMEVLIRTPINDMGKEIDNLYAQTAEIATVLRKFEEQVNYVRKVRDTLRTSLLIWDDMLERWDETPGDQLTDALSALCKETYRFLAQNFQQTQRWASVI